MCECAAVGGAVVPEGSGVTSPGSTTAPPGSPVTMWSSPGKVDIDQNSVNIASAGVLPLQGLEESVTGPKFTAHSLPPTPVDASPSRPQPRNCLP